MSGNNAEYGPYYFYSSILEPMIYLPTGDKAPYFGHVSLQVLQRQHPILAGVTNIPSKGHSTTLPGQKLLDGKVFGRNSGSHCYMPIAAPVLPLSGSLVSRYNYVEPHDSKSNI